VAEGVADAAAVDDCDAADVASTINVALKSDSGETDGDAESDCVAAALALADAVEKKRRYCRQYTCIWSPDSTVYTSSAAGDSDAVGLDDVETVSLGEVLPTGDHESDGEADKVADPEHECVSEGEGEYDDVTVPLELALPEVVGLWLIVALGLMLAVTLSRGVTVALVLALPHALGLPISLALALANPLAVALMVTTEPSAVLR
jgi:hypothetical protein